MAKSLSDCFHRASSKEKLATDFRLSLFASKLTFITLI